MPDMISLTDPGAIITARPWVKGAETAPRNGLVMGTEGDHLLVWFPTMGELVDGEAGHAVQVILPRKAMLRGSVYDRPAHHVAAWCKRVNRGGYEPARALYATLCAAYRRTVSA